MERHPVYGLAVPERGWVPAPRYALRRQRVLRLTRDLPSGRLLEVGCGAGALLADFAARGFACTALEASDAARLVAEYVHRGDSSVHIAAVPEPDWAGAFDVLVSLEVLEHIADDAAALLLWRSWLRPGGTLVLSVPAREELWSASDVWVGHFRRYERAPLLRLLADAGFAVEHSECYGFPLSNWTETVRARAHGRRLRRQGEERAVAERAAHTAASGVERSIESRAYRLQASLPGTLAFRACGWLQERFLDRDWGTGFLVLARRSG